MSNDTMTARERFHAVMNFRPFDRLPIVEWAGRWNQTVDRWHGEGLPEELNGRAICAHLGMDLWMQTWFPAQTAECPRPAAHGAPIMEDETDYEKLRPFLYPEPTFDTARWEDLARRQEKGEIAVWFTVDGFFWFPRKLFGIEPHLYAFYDYPELMHRINNDLVEWQLRVFDAVCQRLTPDFMTFGEDMSYNHGPMLSKDLFDEFLAPYYRRAIPALKERGILPVVDSDGDITEPVAWFGEVGAEGMLPLERQAGVDVAALREAHPSMRFIGCFDKMTMNRGEAAMRAEFERLLPVAAKGGLAVSVDHQTPPGVSFDEYKLFLRLFREYAEEAGRMSRRAPMVSGG